jgi:aconitate hydratase
MSAPKTVFDPFGARDTFSTSQGPIGLYRIQRLEELGLGAVSRLPFSIRIMLEAVLRNCDGYVVTEENVRQLAAWEASPACRRSLTLRRCGRPCAGLAANPNGSTR